MKIIYLETRLLANNGPINQAYNLATAFKKLGIDFRIICISEEIEGKSNGEKFIKAGLHVLHLKHKSYDIKGCVNDLRKYIIKNKIDIVHSSGPIS